MADKLSGLERRKLSRQLFCENLGRRPDGRFNHKPQGQYVPGVRHLAPEIMEIIDNPDRTAEEEEVASRAILELCAVIRSRWSISETRRREGFVPPVEIELVSGSYFGKTG